MLAHARNAGAVVLGGLGCALWMAACAHGQTPPLTTHFADQPADALIRQMEPGVGFSADLTEPDAEALAKRWNVAEGAPGEVVATDPATGLVVSQQRQWRADLGLLLLETTLSNRGNAVISLERIHLADWSLRVADGREALRYRELTYRTDQWYGSTYWSGPDWTRVGKDWHHPGENTPSVRRFTAPAEGRATITGRVRKAHLDGDGVRVGIVHRGRTVWQAEIEGKDAQGVEPNLTLDLARGDSIRFVVHKRGKIFCDTTYWDPVVTYADGRRFQASAAFAAAKQGADAWHYEMEVGGPTSLGLPRVYSFGRDLALREQTPGLGEAMGLSCRDRLPLAIVADGADRSGLALAVARDGPWEAGVALAEDGRLRIKLTAVADEGRFALQPSQSLRLPTIALGAYRGPWLNGMALLQRWIDARQLPIARAPATDLPALDYWAMIQADWRQADKLAETPASYAAATAGHLEKARLLLADLRKGPDDPLLAAEAGQVEHLGRSAQRPGLSLDEQRSLWLQARWLKRRIILANPLLQFGKLLFTKRVPTSYSHLVMQYYGWRARPGGGIFVLEEPGRSLACRDILGGRLSDGNVLEPRLFWDGRRIIFSYVRCAPKAPEPASLDNQTDEAFYHVYVVNVDGTGLAQLTSGPYDDLMPTWLPDGGIAFSSTRRRGYARCFGAQFSPRWHVYTLHRMDADGRNLRALSFHDTNEWFPTVSPSGLILYARWDYIDRDAVTHQNLWATRPDGTNPVAVWGNATAAPHCSFQAQPIPGTSKIVITAAPHHSITAGSIAIVDPTKARDGQEAITRVTPEIPFPEAEGNNIPEYYASPWPLSDKYFLVSYSPRPLVWEPGANEPNALGLYVLDVFGNRELLYRDPEIGSENPCPLAARPAPPVVASHLPEHAEPCGQMTLIDVYEGLGAVARGSIKELRVVQIFPKTTHVANSPPIGLAAEENGRAILGTVPVEADGSARFTVPAGRPVLFQALDQDGFAYQTMRTVTYVQPGEKIACVGCHEHRMTAPPAKHALALRRPASPIDPGPWGGRPFCFVEVVQPVLDQHCVRCHGGEKTEGKIDLTATPSGHYTRSYVALCGDRDFWGAGTNPRNAAEALVPRFGARNQVQITPPGGAYGALGSRLIRLLRQGHYESQLADDDYRRLAAWIDLNAIFYGVNLPEDQARQLRGELVAMPQVQ